MKSHLPSQKAKQDFSHPPHTESAFNLHIRASPDLNPSWKVREPASNSQKQIGSRVTALDFQLSQNQTKLSGQQLNIQRVGQPQQQKFGMNLQLYNEKMLSMNQITMNIQNQKGQLGQKRNLSNQTNVMALQTNKMIEDQSRQTNQQFHNAGRQKKEKNPSQITEKDMGKQNDSNKARSRNQNKHPTSTSFINQRGTNQMHQPFFEGFTNVGQFVSHQDISSQHIDRQNQRLTASQFNKGDTSYTSLKNNKAIPTHKIGSLGGKFEDKQQHPFQMRSNSHQQNYSNTGEILKPNNQQTFPEYNDVKQKKGNQHLENNHNQSTESFQNSSGFLINDNSTSQTKEINSRSNVNPASHSPGKNEPFIQGNISGKVGMGRIIVNKKLTPGPQDEKRIAVINGMITRKSSKGSKQRNRVTTQSKEENEHQKFLKNAEIEGKSNSQKDPNPVLNIKTVQDINIYNNSFIVNANNPMIPPNIQGQVIQMYHHATQGRNSRQDELVQQIQHRILNNQSAGANENQGLFPNQAIPTIAQSAKRNNFGLKLKKDFIGFQEGLDQSRSASLGRNLEPSQSNLTQINFALKNQSKDIIKIYNPTGQNPRAYSKEEKGSFGFANQVLDGINLTNIKQNPNQMRILYNINAKAQGNKRSIKKKLGEGDSSRNQGVQFANTYYSSNKEPKGQISIVTKQGTQKILQNKTQSTTTRLQNRNDTKLVQETNPNPGGLIGSFTNQKSEDSKHSSINRPQTKIENQTKREQLMSHYQSHIVLGQSGPNLGEVVSGTILKNLGSQEVRKQSVQELNKPELFKQVMNKQFQSGRQDLYQNKSNKFRNQITQVSGDNSVSQLSLYDKSELQSSPPKLNQFTQIVTKHLQEIQEIIIQVRQQLVSLNSKVSEMKQIPDEEYKLQIGVGDKLLSKLEKCGRTLKQMIIQSQGDEKLSSETNKILTQQQQLQAEIQIKKASLMLDHSQSFEAISEINQLLLTFKTHPSDFMKYAFIIKAIAQKNSGQPRDAIETLNRCLESYPGYRDALYLRGQIYLIENQIQQSLRDFQSIISLQDQGGDDSFSQKWGYLSNERVGDCFKQKRRYKQALQAYQEALRLLRESYKSGSSKKTGNLDTRIASLEMKIGMTHYYLGNQVESQKLLQKIIQFYSTYDQSQVKVQELVVKSKFYLAKSILALKESSPEISKVDYQRALIYLQECNEDHIDPEHHDLYSGNALFEIAKVFLRQKDILNANEFIMRAVENNFSSKRLSIYKDFTDGVVQLMKRKIKKGVQILTDLLEVLINGQREVQQNEKKEQSLMKTVDRYNESIEDPSEGKDENKVEGRSSGNMDQDMYDFLIFYIYIHRSYGYVAIEKYEYALEDIAKAKKICPNSVDNATVYNKWLSRGILKMDTEEYLMASKYFSKAILRFPDNKDAYCLNVISVVRSYSLAMRNVFIDEDAKREKIIKTKQFLDVSIAACCKNHREPSLYFFRGLLNFQIHNFYEALNDFNIAIQEEEEPTGQFHLARGRTYACLSIIDEALKDLTAAIDFDGTLLDAYICRGKCAYLIGDNNLAFHDFQKVILADQRNPFVHISAGDLLMTTGAYSDAIKAFDNADSIHQTGAAAFKRIKCYCALTQIEKALEQMQLFKQLCPNEKLAQIDYQVMLQIISCVRSFKFLAEESDKVQGRKEQREILENCVVHISQTIAQMEEGQNLNLKKGESPLTIQILPNVNRIKLEKQLVSRLIKESKNKDKQYESIPLSNEELLKIQEHPVYTHYHENIFQLDEMLLYRAIFQLYLHEYSAALNDLQDSRKIVLMAKARLGMGKGKKTERTQIGFEVNSSQDLDEMLEKFMPSNMCSPLNSTFNSQKTDLSDVGLCSQNQHEFSINFIIVTIQLQDWNQALAKINDFLLSPPVSSEYGKSFKAMHLVRALVHQELGNTEKFNQDMTIYIKNFQKVKKNDQGAVLIEVFPSEGRLCQFFDPIELKFGRQKAKGGFSVLMRPSFSMPFIKPPNMIPSINEEVIQSEFNLKQIDAPMPEAAWVRSCKNQDFNPFLYLQEKHIQDQVNPKKIEKKGQFLPKNQPITKMVFDQNSEKLVVDEKIGEEIDNLSDFDKVSLISDIIMPSPGLKKNSGTQDGLKLKLVSQLQTDGGVVSRVSNGVRLTRQKYRCERSNSCCSCYDHPNPAVVIKVGNNDNLVSYLSKSTEEKRKFEAAAFEEFAKKNNNGELPDDTVSELDAHEIDSEDEKKKSKSQSESRYTHSRFSSNVQELQENELKSNNPLSETNIEGQLVEVNLAEGRKVNSKEKTFNDIESIQKNSDKNYIDEVASVAKSANDQERESLVLMGSNRDELAQKKKQRKSGGVGFGAIQNLRKNKLAIAFNNLDAEEQRRMSKD